MNLDAKVELVAERRRRGDCRSEGTSQSDRRNGDSLKTGGAFAKNCDEIRATASKNVRTFMRPL
jgi:hypothetical protein